MTALMTSRSREVRAPRARRTNQSVRLRVRTLNRRPTCAGSVCLVPCLDLPPNPIPPLTPTPTSTPAPAHRTLALARSSFSLSPLSRRLAPPPDNRFEASPSHPTPIHLGLPPLSPGLAPKSLALVPWDLWLSTLPPVGSASHTLPHKQYGRTRTTELRGSSPPSSVLSPHSLAHRNATYRTTPLTASHSLLSSLPRARPLRSQSQSYHQETRTHPPLTLPRPPPPIAFLAPTYVPFVLAVPQLSLSLFSPYFSYISLSLPIPLLSVSY
ncbi:hypothetical protein CSAL01_11223 [Colletotrichum salicis]|uniref:Uncharacterized protein n=1 Tax=Colletotrichum salicis TaxID=1209931 RepID=A0A135UM24_9PEZI|nr:hypothetical protein CSAL01_11223 [Colletotrichum salicis]